MELNIMRLLILKSFLLLFVCNIAQANNLNLPPELKPWQQWVLHDSPIASCPFIYNKAERACVWPTSLELDLNKSGGTFTLKAEAFAQQWLSLPGENSLWPTQVKNQARFIPVINRKGEPAIFLPTGAHTIKGNFSWSNLPRTLTIPKDYGLLSLRIDGKEVTTPNIDRSGKLWLGQKQASIKKEAARDTLTAKVFRRLNDDTPQTITTLLQLNISGGEREVQLGPILLPNTTPASFKSPLPARIEDNGALRIQVKPGRFDIRLNARVDQPTNQFGFNPQNGLWPKQELWVFAENRNQRTVQVEGAPIIDASQTQVPDAWQNLPAYLLTPGTQLTLKELHRGDPKPATNQLNLEKHIWLDFSGKGYTVMDTISGTMHQGWRLEVIPPYELGRADIDGKPQLITTLTDSDAAGIEVRTRDLALNAVSRLAKTSDLPVSGWQQEFHSVKSTIALPPGWSALHVSGADSVRGAWLTAWNLWDIFLVLVIAVSLARVVSLPVGLLALATLIMVYQKTQAPVIGWLNIGACLALLPYVKGRFGKWLSGYLAVSFVGLTLLVLPFIVQEARLVFYPQLAQKYGANSSLNYAVKKERKQQVASLPKKVKAMSGPMLSRMSEDIAVEYDKNDSESNSFQAAYDPSQKIQVGPGVPNWRWKTIHAQWSGPVKAEEATRFILVSPLFNRLGHALSIFLVAALLLLLAKRFLHYNPMQLFKTRANHSDNDNNITKKIGATSAALLILVGALTMPTQDIHANVVIDKNILAQLKKRLLAPPKCQPHCAAIESVNINLTGEALSIKYWVNIQSNLAFPLPGTLGEWWPDTVKVDSKNTVLLHTHKSQLFLYLEQGRHLLELNSSIDSLEAFNLNFSFPLQNLDITVPGWQVGGLPSAKNASQSLQFSRRVKATAQAEKNRLLPDPIAPYVVVTRNIEFGLEWSLLTQVTRVAPQSGPINLSIPLLHGEAPTSGEVKTPGFMNVRLRANQRQVQWRSNLPITDTLILQASENRHWSETWTIKTTPMWHTRFEGIPTVAKTGQNVWPIWQPKPDEQLSIHIRRPQPTEGAHIAIDDVTITHSPGARASDTELTVTLRATYGSQLDLPLPANSVLKQVRINNIDTPVSQVENVLKIPVIPGEQNIQVEWQTPIGTKLKTQTPQVALGHPATNISLNMRMPRDRWTIAVGGPALGPAILFWGVLAVVIALAIALGKSKLTPLKPYEWILLSLGVATFNLVVLALIAAWFVVLTQRGKLQQEPTNTKFNLFQVLLFVFSGTALLALISSVPSSLLSSPEMYITGNASTSHVLNWYQDQSLDTLPQAWVISLPMLVYKLTMLLWSLWLAFALMRWIRWAWTQLGVQGYWYTAPQREQTQTNDKNVNKADQSN